MPTVDPDNARCEFTTTKPLGAMSQPARRRPGSGPRSATRYHRCRNRATRTLNIDGRTVRCCGLHARLHYAHGWLP
jgi:hypothetical protein